MTIDPFSRELNIFLVFSVRRVARMFLCDGAWKCAPEAECYMLTGSGLGLNPGLDTCLDRTVRKAIDPSCCTIS